MYTVYKPKNQNQDRGIGDTHRAQMLERTVVVGTQESVRHGGHDAGAQVGFAPLILYARGKRAFCELYSYIGRSSRAWLLYLSLKQRLV